MEDLEAAKATIAEFNDHMEDVKDLLQEYREETTEQIETLKRRLKDIESESQQQSEVERNMSDFYEGEDGDGRDETPDHEDMML